MIDIHTHILPGVDDGSQSISDSIAMAKLAVKSGVKGIIVTPHCEYPNGDGIADAREMRRTAKEFQNALDENGIPLRIFTGMEISAAPDTAGLLQNGIYAALADSRYALIEFSFTHYSTQTTHILESLLSIGTVPVIAHPERYLYVQEDPEILNIWADMGCLLQINRGSILGRFGELPQLVSNDMLDRGFVSFIASDAHGSDQRTTWMSDIWQFLCRQYSPKCAKTLLWDNPLAILKNKEIPADEPQWF